MNADLIFENVRAYGVNRFEVRIGETFRVKLSDPAKWFTDNDPVFAIQVDADGAGATLKALEKGKCEIQLQDESRTVQLLLTAEVFDNIAVSLNPSAGNPELK